MGIYDDPTWYITDETLQKAQALWDEAEALAADEAELAVSAVPACKCAMPRCSA